MSYGPSRVPETSVTGMFGSPDYTGATNYRAREISQACNAFDRLILLACGSRAAEQP